MSIKNIGAWLDNFEDHAIPDVLRSIRRYHNELVQEHGSEVFVRGVDVVGVDRHGAVSNEFTVTFRKPGNIVTGTPAMDFTLYWVLPLIDKAEDGIPFYSSWKGRLLD